MSGIIQGLLASLVTTVSAAVTDAYFYLTTLLLPGNGTNGAQNNTFLDSSSNNFTITRNGNTTQGTFTPFSQTGWGNYFNGSTDYLTIPTNTAFAFGTSDFTIEAWVYNAGTTATVAVLFGATTYGTASNFIVYLNGSTNKINWYGPTGTTVASTNTLTSNTWTHVAIVKSSGTVTIYLNGVANGSVPDNNSISSTITPTIGSDTSNNAASRYLGYVSNLRVTKGGALYTSALYPSGFTPSTVPLTTTVSAGTVSLLTCQSNRFVDNGTANAGSGFTITPSGTPSVQAFSPFAPTAAYSTSAVGGSGYFGPTGDYLTGATPLSSSTSMSTFTIEGWLYPTTFANVIWLIGDMAATSGVNVLSVDISTGGAVELYWYDGAVKRCTSTGLMKLNQWNWFAIVVNANAISIYVNSTTSGQSGTTTLTNRTTSQNFSVGAYNSSTTPGGYIGSLRWSNGIARTISSIPTAPYTSDANTQLLLNFTNAGITDATAKNDLQTVGSAQISTTQSKFGGSSMSFNGSGSYLKGALTPVVQIGSGDYTFECWVYANSLAASKAGEQTLITYGVNGFLISIWNSDVHLAQDNVADKTDWVSSSVTNTTWFHLAVCRSGTSTRCFINGTQIGSTYTDSTNYTGTGGVYIGANSSGATAFNGYIDDLRITKYARYPGAGPYPVPTAAFPVQ